MYAKFVLEVNFQLNVIAISFKKCNITIFTQNFLLYFQKVSARIKLSHKKKGYIVAKETPFHVSLFGLTITDIRLDYISVL